MDRTRTTYGTFHMCIQSFSGKPEGKRPLGRPRHRWEDNIRMDLREVGCDPGKWIDLAQWLAYVRAVMNLQYFNILKIKILNRNNLEIY